MTEPTKTISLSVIDALITEVEETITEFSKQRLWQSRQCYQIGLGLLKRLKENSSPKDGIKKKEAIPSLTPSELQTENTMLRQLVNGYRKEFRKEDKGLEQKIKDRIKELEDSFDMKKDARHQQRVYYGIDELRKLLK